MNRIDWLSWLPVFLLILGVFLIMMAEINNHNQLLQKCRNVDVMIDGLNLNSQDYILLGGDRFVLLRVPEKK